MKGDCATRLGGRGRKRKRGGWSGGGGGVDEKLPEPKV